MTTIVRRSAYLLVLLALAACNEPRWLPLKDSDVRAAFFGNTAHGTDVDGAKWTMWIAPDGKAVFRGANADGSPLNDTGMARIDGDQLCVDWQKMHQDKPFCEVIYNSDRGPTLRAYSADLTLNATILMAPGNADNL